MLAGAELEDQGAYPVRCSSFRWGQVRPGP